MYHGDIIEEFVSCASLVAVSLRSSRLQTLVGSDDSMLLSCRVLSCRARACFLVCNAFKRLHHRHLQKQPSSALPFFLQKHQCKMKKRVIDKGRQDGAPRGSQWKRNETKRRRRRRCFCETPTPSPNECRSMPKSPPRSLGYRMERHDHLAHRAFAATCLSKISLSWLALLAGRPRVFEPGRCSMSRDYPYTRNGRRHLGQPLSGPNNDPVLLLAVLLDPLSDHHPRLLANHTP